LVSVLKFSICDIPYRTTSIVYIKNKNKNPHFSSLFSLFSSRLSLSLYLILMASMAEAQSFPSESDQGHQGQGPRAHHLTGSVSRLMWWSWWRFRLNKAKPHYSLPLGFSLSLSSPISLSLSQLDRTKVAPDLLIAVCGGGVNIGFGVGFDNGCFGRGVMDLVVLGFRSKLI
jgi:hypothetical protein